MPAARAIVAATRTTTGIRSFARAKHERILHPNDLVPTLTADAPGAGQHSEGACAPHKGPECFRLVNGSKRFQFVCIESPQRFRSHVAKGC
jgi:hypothetical protein